MAYTPTVWETGDVITAEKLNNIEDGIVSNDSRIDFIMPYVLEAQVEINPQTLSVVANTFEVLDGSFAEVTSVFSKSLLVLHMIVTGTAVEYGVIFLKPAVHTFAIQSVQDEDYAWTTEFALHASGIGFAQVTWDVDDETATPALSTLAIAQ